MEDVAEIVMPLVDLDVLEDVQDLVLEDAILNALVVVDLDVIVPVMMDVWDLVA